MNAAEMFEKLGFEKNKFNGWFSWCKTGAINNMITFYLEDKYFFCEYYGHVNRIDMPLLKAINQQCRELGWLDE